MLQKSCEVRRVELGCVVVGLVNKRAFLKDSFVIELKDLLGSVW